MQSKQCQTPSSKTTMANKGCQTTIAIVDKDHKEVTVLQETADLKEIDLRETIDHKENVLRETIDHKESVLRETINLKATDLREAIDLKANVHNSPTTSQTLEIRIQEMPNKASK